MFCSAERTRENMLLILQNNYNQSLKSFVIEREIDKKSCLNPSSPFVCYCFVFNNVKQTRIEWDANIKRSRGSVVKAESFICTVYRNYLFQITYWQRLSPMYISIAFRVNMFEKKIKTFSSEIQNEMGYKDQPIFKIKTIHVIGTEAMLNFWRYAYLRSCIN